jgi:hypothetical protein
MSRSGEPLAYISKSSSQRSWSQTYHQHESQRINIQVLHYLPSISTINQITKGVNVWSLRLALLVVARVVLLDPAVEETLASPVGVEVAVLRFLEGGGVEGGAEATVAFFLVRAMIAMQKLVLERVVPILMRILRDRTEGMRVKVEGRPMI